MGSARPFSSTGTALKMNGGDRSGYARLENIPNGARVSYHDVCGLGVAGVELRADVEGLDLDLHRGRSVDEHAAGVVGAGRGRVLKHPAGGEQLDVTVCGREHYILYYIKLYLSLETC